jgi:peptidyl-prolyl cis-trans isomerase C
MKRLHCTALLLSGLLAACGQPSSSTPKATDVVATVNGKPLPRSEFEMYLANIERQANGVKLDSKEREEALDQYIGMHLAADAAAKRGLDKEPKVADELAFARTRVLSEAGLQRYLEENPVKEEELEPAYKKGVAELPPQYHSSHIQVDNPGTAEELIIKLKGGADFPKLAKQHTLDEKSKPTSGDIGWWTAEDLDPAYAAAVAALEPGGITQTPVKTRSGWHVIRLEAKKAQDVSPFNDVKDKVRLLVTRQRVKGYLKTLREQAKIKVEQRGPKG